MRIFGFIVVFMALCAASVPAQFKDQGLGLGVSFGGTFGQTDIQDKKAQFLGRAFLRYGLINHIQAELGGGLGKVSGAEYRSFIVPVELRVLLSPLNSETWNPYVYAGFGRLFYDQQEFPATVIHPYQSDWTSVIPLGVGVQYLLSDRTALEATGGYNRTGTDQIKGVSPSPNDDAYWSFSLGLTVLGESGSADPDHDGLTNDEEKELGTDPHNADTDGDGISDGDEVHVYHTDPLKKDTDGDGLSDYDEIFKYHTDPLKVDTDGDGLSDGDEVLKYHTDPLKMDTDGDGLSDGDEVLKYHTDPLKMDTDGDGLSDGDEVMKYHTDPLKVDTDGGTVSDGDEIKNGTNPLDSTDDVKKPEIKVEAGQAIVLEGVLFESGKSDIQPQSDSILTLAYNTLKQNPAITVEIRGFTDNTGSKKKNMKLSQDRADAVKNYLVTKGISGDRITTKGFGPDQPVASNATKEGKQKNRRIEFFRTK
ncbi:MAG TPA: OmpA family protein [Bacteroidota bacterium]|nr:OmpA family protein [Bacteroidota bacterium]